MQKLLSRTDTPGYQSVPPSRNEKLPPLTAKPLFDLAQIDESWGGADDETYRIILGIFAPEAEGLSAQLAALVAEGDTASRQRLAHTLRGAASNVGAAQLAGCALALEHAPPAAAASRFAELRTALQATLAIIAAGGPAAHG
jgi:two-component system sensor histidine kinase/response regulator